MMELTGATVTDEDLRALRMVTGWRGPRCVADQATIFQALQGDTSARKLCAAWLNERRRRT